MYEPIEQKMLGSPGFEDPYEEEQWGYLYFYASEKETMFKAGIPGDSAAWKRIHRIWSDKTLDRNVENQYFVCLFKGKGSVIYSLESKFKTEFKDASIPYSGGSSKVYKGEFFILKDNNKELAKKMILWFKKKGEELGLHYCSREQITKQNKILKANKDRWIL